MGRVSWNIGDLHYNANKCFISYHFICIKIVWKKLNIKIRPSHLSMFRWSLYTFRNNVFTVFLIT